MLIFALDTSGDVCSVALSEGTTLRVEYRFRHERRLSERLPGMIDFLLRDAGVRLRDVEGFAVGIGPGSFTGIRVGVTMAKLWAYSLGKPLVGISSLDALVEPLLPLARGKVVATVAPTRRTESVAAFYSGESATPILPPAVLANDAIVREAWKSLPGASGVIVCGEAAPIVRAATPGDLLVSLLVESTPVTAAAVARLATPRFAAGETDDPDILTPLYVTPSPVG